MRHAGTWTAAVVLCLSASTALCLPKSKPWSLLPGSETNVFTVMEALEGKLKLPSCKLERKTTIMPTPNGGYSSAFSQPETNLDISGVYFGHGTQNYTCADENAVPKANGAKAEIVDMSCFVKQNPEAAHRIPREYMNGRRDFLNGLINIFAVAGDHIFPDASTPVFHFFNDPQKRIFIGKKKENVACPNDDNIGDHGTVDWLNLDVTDAAVGFKRAYRVVTAGGKAPATCKGLGSSFEVPYATEYWFWSEKKDIK